MPRVSGIFRSAIFQTICDKSKTRTEGIREQPNLLSCTQDLMYFAVSVTTTMANVY